MNSGTLISGKLVLLVMLVVTLGLAGFAVWYRQYAGRLTRANWGVVHAQRIQIAPEVDLLRLTTPRRELAGPPEPQGDEQWQSIGRRSGMTHVRGALLEDRSFAWQDPAASCPSAWEYVMRFRDEQGATHVALDLECQRLWVLEEGRPVSFAPMATFLKRFVHSQYGPAQ